MTADQPAAPRAAADVLILRDPRESERKCSLTPLRGRAGIEFVPYRHDRRIDVGRRILLHVDGEPLGAADAQPGLLLVDCAWRRVERLLATVDGELIPRSLPPLRTAYPRTSKTFVDPARGLASVEALYAACALTGRPTEGLFDGYRWADEFLALNPTLSG